MPDDAAPPVPSDEKPADPAMSNARAEATDPAAPPPRGDAAGSSAPFEFLPHAEPPPPPPPPGSDPVIPGPPDAPAPAWSITTTGDAPDEDLTVPPPAAGASPGWGVVPQTPIHSAPVIAAVPEARWRRTWDNAMIRTTMFLRLLFGVMELILAVRIALVVGGANSDAGFMRFVHFLTDWLVAPFHALFPDPTVNGHPFELGSFVGMAAYLVLAWLAERFVRIWLRRNNLRIVSF